MTVRVTLVTPEAFDEMTARLRRAQTAYAQARSKTETLRADRDAIVLSAREQGWSLAQIAKATGLSRGRIGTIK